MLIAGKEECYVLLNRHKIQREPKTLNNSRKTYMFYIKYKECTKKFKRKKITADEERLIDSG